MVDKIDNDLTDYGSIVSFELKQALREGLDLFTLFIPIGEIVPIMTGVPGVPAPDPNLFQECNGSEITNPGSPLRSIGSQQRYTPDMRDRYIKVPTVFGQSGQLGGYNSSYILRHRHGGITGSYITPEAVDHSNYAREAAFSHYHGIEYSFNGGAVNLEPPFYTLRFFMRIQ